MCLQFLVHYLFPLLFILIALCFSWNRILCLRPYPCATINMHIQVFYARQSLTPNTLASLELFVLNCFLLDLQCTIQYPTYIPLPVCLFRSGCIPYEESTHVHSWMRLSSPITLLSLIFRFTNFSTKFSLDFSSTVLFVNLGYRNDISGSMSGIQLFDTHSIF